MQPPDSAKNSLTRILSATNIINQKYCDLYDTFFAQKLFERRDYKSDMSVLDGLIYDAEETAKETNALVNSQTWGKECSIISRLLPYQKLLVERITSLRTIVDHLYAKSYGHAYSLNDYNKDIEILKNMEAQSVELGKNLHVALNTTYREPAPQQPTLNYSETKDIRYERFLDDDTHFIKEPPINSYKRWGIINWLIKLKNGDYSLAVTFWGFNGVFCLTASVISALISNAPITIIPTWLRWVYIVILYLYNPILLLGIWRSAAKYDGRFLWAALAKASVICGVLLYISSLGNILSSLQSPQPRENYASTQQQEMISTNIEPQKYANWQEIIVPDVCSFQIPETMEIQEGEYKKFMEELYKKYSNSTYTGVIIAQQKGLNDRKSSALKLYARVIVQCVEIPKGDGFKLGQRLLLSQQELEACDDMVKQRVEMDRQGTIKMGGTFSLLSWEPTKVVNINGNDCLLTVYRRSVNNNSSAVVHAYVFFNNDRVHHVQISYREKDASLWKNDLDKLIYTFNFVKR